MAIGAAFNGNNFTGSASVFRFNSTIEDWSPLGDILPGRQEYDLFGTSIALNGNGMIVAVGAKGNSGDSPSNTRSGYVRIYRYDEEDSGWMQVGQVIEGSDPSSSFGAAVDISDDGTRLVVTSLRSNCREDVNSGELLMFDFDGTSWQQQGYGLCSEDGRFSVSMSANGEKVAVGAWLAHTDGVQTGNAKVYFRGEQNDWLQLGNVIVGEASGDQAGYSLSLSEDGNIVAVGAIRHDGRNGIGSGQVRVFMFHEGRGEWLQIGTDLVGAAQSDLYGTSVSLSSDGGLLVVGGPSNDDGGLNAGHARVFTLDTPCPRAVELPLLGARLSFTSVPFLNETDIADFEAITRAWYADFLATDQSMVNLAVRNVLTEIQVNDQVIAGNEENTTNSISYNHFFSVIQLKERTTAHDLAAGPFTDDERVQRYVEALKQRVPGFQNVGLAVDLILPDIPGSEASGLSLQAILGIVAGSVCLGIAVLLLVLRRRGQKDAKDTIFVGPGGISNLPHGVLVEPAEDNQRPEETATGEVIIEALALDAFGETPNERGQLEVFDGLRHASLKRNQASESQYAGIAAAHALETKQSYNDLGHKNQAYPAAYGPRLGGEFLKRDSESSF